MNQPAVPPSVLRCNIGEAEIGRRRRMAIVLTIVTVVFAVALLALAVPALVRLVVFPVAAAAAVTWLQVTNRFCVAFGAAGLENFGPLGSEHRVDREQAAADRRRALLLTAEGALIGLLVACVFAALPI